MRAILFDRRHVLSTPDGQYPFGNGPMLSVMTRKMSNQYVPPIIVLPWLSASVNATICKCLHYDPAKAVARWKVYSDVVVAENVNGDLAPGSDACSKRGRAAPKQGRKSRSANCARNEMEIEASCRAVAGAPMLEPA